MQGPELPRGVEGHAMINIGNDKTVVIGGITGSGSAQTFIYNHNHGNWSYGPSLIQARIDHAAGIVTDEVTHETLTIVTGGIFSGVFLKSTEILKGGSWTLGEKIDKNLYKKTRL